MHGAAWSRAQAGPGLNLQSLSPSPRPAPVWNENTARCCFMFLPACFWKCSLCFHLPPLQRNQWVSESEAVMAGVMVCGLASTPPCSLLPSGARILEKRPPSILIFKVAEVRMSLKALFSSPLMCSLHLPFRLSFDALTCGPRSQCRVSCDGGLVGRWSCRASSDGCSVWLGDGTGKGGTYRAGLGSCGQLGAAVG